MGLSLKEVQSTELTILKAVHLYCEEHGLKYILGYGTLLGAVRHNGFIPWDNDIDILMPRDDFIRFLNMTKTKPISDSLYIQHYSLDDKFHYLCARVCDANTHVFVPYIREQPERLGLWVDIFPMDGLGKKSIKFFVQRVLIKWYWILFRADVYDSTRRNSRNYFNYLVKKIALVLFPNKKNSHNYLIDRICRWFPFEKSEQVSFLFGEEGLWGIPRTDFDELIKLSFEDSEFFCPKSYDMFLRQCYGDYMILPKEEDRITHDIDVIVLNK